MKKWSVMFAVDASVCVEVEADTEFQAIEKATEIVESPSICHYCSNKIEIGDIGECVEATAITEN